ncbi:uncharacterized protein N7483_005467 [Penicillium malachiteum]|uniref:uncharacterized protein n=1 Tax=Penicillium malachiteum TaxID=1324776 RepID=UPI002546B35F|nr:uncharacterized protein N7483_005467 [Penicillium malachiteum]KAJ5730959.1 hypothetical protein N7483_005467 [Penicillium malachiteum]
MFKLFLTPILVGFETPNRNGHFPTMTFRKNRGFSCALKPRPQVDEDSPGNTKSAGRCLAYNDEFTDSREEQGLRRRDLEKIQRELYHRESRLRDTLSKLPPVLQLDYNHLRGQSLWYMRNH